MTQQTSQNVVIRRVVPPYGQRKGWKPTSQEDFGLQCLFCFFSIKAELTQVMAAHTPNVMLLNFRWKWGKKRWEFGGGFEAHSTNQLIFWLGLIRQHFGTPS